MAGIRIVGFAAAGFAFCGIIAGSAYGATYYAKPGGPSAGECATPADGCALEYAVETKSGPSDTVLVLPGTHPLADASTLVVDGETVRGLGPGRPVIAKGGGVGLAVGVQNNAVLSGLTVSSAGSLAMQAFNATGRRLFIDGLTGLAVFGGSNTLTDSVVISRDAGAPGLQISGAIASEAMLTLRSSTIVAAGMGADGIRATPSCDPPPGACANSTIDATNVVVRGSGADLHALTALSGEQGRIEISYSNFRTSAGPGTISQGPGNQTSPDLTATSAVFTDLDSEDLSPPPGSPLIDAGTDTAANGDLDLDGAPRPQGEAPDIGAWEATPDPPLPPPDPTAEELRPTPETRLARSPKKRIKTARKRKRLVYRFESSLPGSMFECAWRKQGWKPCGSPFQKRVRALPGKRAKTYIFKARAISNQGVVDRTPVSKKTKVKRRVKRSPR